MKIIFFFFFRHHMSIYVGREGKQTMSSPSLHAQADTHAPPTVSLTEGEETAIHCNVKGAFPAPVFNWEGVPALNLPSTAYSSLSTAAENEINADFGGAQIRVRKYAKALTDKGRGLYGNITVVQQVDKIFIQNLNCITYLSLIHSQK